MVVDEESEQLKLLREIAKWTREGALPAVRARVVGLLDTDTKKRVYQAIADGKLTPRALETVAATSRVTAQNLVTEWEAAGIVVAGSNPPKAVFTLTELGIAPPAAKPAPATKSAKA